MPNIDPELRLGDYFIFGFITGISLVIVASILMWRAARWEIEQITARAIDELRETEHDLAAQLQKYRAENESLREELARLRGTSLTG